MNIDACCSRPQECIRLRAMNVAETPPGICGSFLTSVSSAAFYTFRLPPSAHVPGKRTKVQGRDALSLDCEEQMHAGTGSLAH